MVVKKTKKKQKEEKILAILTGNTIQSNSQRASELHGSKRFGEQKSGRIIYTIYEALYLLETHKIEIYQRKKSLEFEELLRKAIRNDKKANTKYLVFRDMRKRGYIMKTALKFGAEFRAYAKGVKPGQDHAKWIIYPFSENESLRWHEFSAKQRVAHSTKKRLLIAVVDDEEDVTYYEIDWIRP